MFGIPPLRPKALAPLSLICALGLGCASTAEAQNTGSGGSELSADYRVEIAPILGKNLPYDLWGVDEGTLNIFGARLSVRLANPGGALEASAFMHHKMPDMAYSAELAYRHEVYSSFLNGYFNVGYHLSYFRLKADLNDDGSCKLPDCATDSGTHSGLSYGGGLMIPVGQWPLKLGVRFYQNPQSWLLLEAGYGIRF